MEHKAVTAASVVTDKEKGNLMFAKQTAKASHLCLEKRKDGQHVCCEATDDAHSQFPAGRSPPSPWSCPRSACSQLRDVMGNNGAWTPATAKPPRQDCSEASGKVAVLTPVL